MVIRAVVSLSQSSRPPLPAMSITVTCSRFLAADAAKGGYFAGCNFWGWGGQAQPKHEQWEPGDDYTGDPAQEAQGLNSVFSSDTSTVNVIKTGIANLPKH